MAYLELLPAPCPLRLTGFSAEDRDWVARALERLRQACPQMYVHVFTALVEIRPATPTDPCRANSTGCTKNDRVARLRMDKLRADPDETLLTIAHEALHYQWSIFGWLYVTHLEPLNVATDRIYRDETVLREMIKTVAH